MMKLVLPLLAAVVAANVPAQSQWWVSPTGSDSNPGTMAQPFLTINHANMMASSGDTIRLAAGTYGDEQGIVSLGNKSVAVIGAGIGSSVIRAHSSATTPLPAGVGVAAQRPVVLISGAARVDLRDLTVDGNFSMPASGRLTGVYVRGGADALLDSIEIKNCRAEPLDSSQTPLAVLVRGDGVHDVSYVGVRNCHLHNWGKNGIASFYSSLMTVEDCRVEGMGRLDAGLPAQNGIQISYNGGATVSRNTVTDIFYNPSSYVATGILIFEASGFVNCDQNGVGNCEAGIIVQNNSPMVLAGSMRNNHVHGGDFAVTLDLVTGVTVAGNSFQNCLASSTDVAFDGAAFGNTWSGNAYSNSNGVGSYPVPGGSMVDLTPRAGAFFLGSPGTIIPLPPHHTPVDMLVAELNGFPGTDIACASQNSTPRLSIGINTGIGSSFILGTLAFANTSSRNVAIAAGEFNGNPGVDIAALTKNISPATTENDIYIFRNNGSGGILLHHNITLATSAVPSDIASGQLDNQAATDLVWTNAATPGGATVLRNNGSGTGWTSVSLGSFPLAVHGAAIGDVNGDGNNDVFVVEGNVSTGRLHGFAGDGLGAFSAMSGSPWTIAAGPTAVTIGDIDGDGDNDVFTTAAGTGTGSVLDEFQNLGGGVFKRMVHCVDNGAVALAIGDLDNDSDPDTTRRDLATANSFSTTLSFQGSYIGGAGFASGGVGFGFGSPVAVGFGNANQDEYMDLFYADSTGDRVVMLPGRASGRIDHYGAGCGGQVGRVPYILPTGAPALPIQPNATFGLGLTNAKPFSIAVFAAGYNPAAVLMPCNLLIANIDPTWFVFTDLDGKAGISLPVPTIPGLIGFTLFAQCGVLDAAATDSVFPGVSLTRGLKLRVGEY